MRWSRLRDRATRLIDDRPAARELLSWYRVVLQAQEMLASDAAKVVEAESSDGSEAPSGSDGSAHVLERVLERMAGDDFGAFVAATLDAANPVLRAAGDDLARSEPAAVLAALQAYREAPSVDPDTFFFRAFLGPIVDVVAASPEGAEQLPLQVWSVRLAIPLANDAVERPCHTTCPRCASAPVVSFLIDEAERKGGRGLTCALCDWDWPFRRAVCPTCGEEDTEKLVYHQPEGLEYVRLDACETCNHYLKSIDLRKAGDAVPVVDEIATPELDVWATDAGLTKAFPNLMGL